MKYRFAAVAAFVSLLMVAGVHDRLSAAGFNTGMLYRYPFEQGVTMTRTQPQNCSCPDHDGSHLQTYAVDWDNGVPNWKIYAANSGTSTCHAGGTGGRTAGSGIVDGIHDSLTGQASIYLHLNACFPYQVETPVRVEQGFYVSNAGTSGGYPQHLHFQVDDDPTGQQPGPLVSIPFSMSDKAQDQNGFAFLGDGPDGPSDNVGVSATQTEPIDAIDFLVLANYWASGGGQGGSWWSIGGSYKTSAGPCIFSNNQFVHACSTLYGSLTLQNYVRYDGLLSAVAKDPTGSAGYALKGANWALMGTPFRSDVMTNQLGPPTSGESAGGITTQAFAGGTVFRNTSRVLQDVYLNGVRRAAYYFQTFGGECYDINGNGAVSLSDTLAVVYYVGTIEGGGPNANGVSFDPRYDVDRSGAVTLADALRVNGQVGMRCTP